ncbi:hypothetical protein RI129_000292 [Pyrocoelia pectoralis]|uniref:Protein krueppel n=1 Tax=Pyrocoelia pectoralis TaxID=417401 RepID=A0AAN7VSD3_9COLE
MNYEECTDLKEFCKGLPLLILPSTLWNVHVDPHYHYAIILHVQMKSLFKLSIDRGILLTLNTVKKTIDTTFFIQNEVLSIPKLNNDIKVISDLSHIIYAMHNIKICPNADEQMKLSNCNKYIDLDSYDDYCTGCKVYTEEHTQPSSFSDLYCIESPAQNEALAIVDAAEQKNFYTCEKCKSNFFIETEFREHLESHMPKKFMCKICNKISAKESSHLKHLRTHSSEKQNLCNVCGKVFCQEYRMKEHLLSHSLVRPFECSTCHKSFRKSYNLKLHEKTHSGIRSYICSMCGKTYTTQSNLKTHIRSTHTKEKPHACTSCDMTFVHPRHLRLHMRKHTGEKPYTCTVCGKCFAKKIHLTTHVRIHTGEKPYKCSDCGKGFTTSGNLNSHKRINHKGIDINTLNK